MPEPCCGNCRCFAPYPEPPLPGEDVPLGVCRRFPPSLPAADGGDRQPETAADMWCAEYRPEGEANA